MTYNLLDEKWIPVLYRDGRWERVGILKALEEAARIRQIAASNPMDRAAILRFFLAILYWAKGNPPPDDKNPSDDDLLIECMEKLEKHQDCFNLLGGGKRFYQYSNATRERTVTDLLHEVPTGNNFWHFRHSIDNVSGLCPACCAMGLIRLPMFSVSGLPDLKAGINGSPPIYVIPWGNNLLATLKANWQPCKEIGEPAWIKFENNPARETEVPILVGLTLLSRHVWLDMPSSPSGFCTGCGSKGSLLIRTCAYETAGDQKNELWTDPHVLYKEEIPRKSFVTQDLTSTGRFKMDRPWTSLFSKIIETRINQEGDRQQTFLIVGFCSDKAKYVDVWERRISFTTGQFHEQIEQWQKESNRLEKRIGRSKSEGKAFITAIRPHIEDRVSAKANEYLERGTEAWQEAAGQYRPFLISISISLNPGISLEAIRLRHDIARVVPNMQLKTEQTLEIDKVEDNNE